VYLVGAGPGDPGLLTLKARDLLTTCDCVLFDQLVNPAILDFVSTAAERLSVGKVGHGAQVTQAEIHRSMIDRARRGQSVVRLKGGCPMVFGRIADETEALRAASVPYEIVPGISSALAAPAYAGIPLTHREHASSFAVLSGHCVRKGSRPAAALARADTLVILMGAKALPSLVDELITAGRPADTPAAFITRATWDDQQVVVGTLATLVGEVKDAGVGAPAVIVVGEVVAVRQQECAVGAALGVSTIS
jgi:uroporphyrin-III C-methyltransferase